MPGASGHEREADGSPCRLSSCSACAPGLEAQGWPEQTATLFDGRVTLGGEATATVAPEDNGHFTYTDYERSSLQLVRLGIAAAIRPIDRLTFVVDLRAEGDTSGGDWSAIPVALYVRVRPWRDRPFDIQAGRIPPVFGVAGRHIYASDNVLIGTPLAWQYLTVLRADAVPANADELIYARSYGWQPGYSVGDDGYARGVPLATAFRYDTGVEARIGDDTSLGLGGGCADEWHAVGARAALVEWRPAGVDARGAPPVSPRG